MSCMYAYGKCIYMYKKICQIGGEGEGMREEREGGGEDEPIQRTPAMPHKMPSCRLLTPALLHCLPASRPALAFFLLPFLKACHAFMLLYITCHYTMQCCHIASTTHHAHPMRIQKVPCSFLPLPQRQDGSASTPLLLSASCFLSAL